MPSPPSQATRVPAAVPDAMLSALGLGWRRSEDLAGSLG